MRLVAAVLSISVLTGQASAWQCTPMLELVRDAPEVLLVRPLTVVRFGASRPLGPTIAGTPAYSDLVEFAVVETIRGVTKGRFQALCPAEDARCRPGANRDALVALPGPPTAAEPPELFCRIADLGVDGMQPGGDELRRLIDRLRLSRPSARP